MNTDTTSINLTDTLTSPKIGTILLFREFSSASAALRTYDIYINDQLISEISLGETYMFKVPAGKYTLKIKIDWAKSETIELDIQENEVKLFKAGAFNNFVLIRTFMPKYYIYLKEEQFNFNSNSIDSCPSSKSSIKTILNSNSKKIEINLSLFSSEISKTFFSNISNFPIDTNVNNYTLSSVRKRMLKVSIVFAFITLVFYKFNIFKAISPMILIAISSCIIYCLFRPIIPKN